MTSKPPCASAAPNVHTNPVFGLPVATFMIRSRVSSAMTKLRSRVTSTTRVHTGARSAEAR
ncbi:MAG: hypothetical protein BGO98_02025 [Myxococcales bacterium 68-20]|nr:MAG: hypothetical protein BGO98_02025 [Myxococcales bacterium 68-20]